MSISAIYSSVACASYFKKSLSWQFTIIGLCCAWQVALEACKEAAGSVQEVHFVLFSSETYNVWKEAASRSFKSASA